MRTFTTLAAVAVALAPVTLAQNPSWDSSTKGPFTPIQLNASDGSISAVFLPYGATLASVLFKDKNGDEKDLVLGYDDLTDYADDPKKPNFGPVVGRYANRIKNGTFSDETTGEVYNTPINENHATTLHGGSYGWGYRTWTVTKVTSDTLELSLSDPAGSEGFPSAVQAQFVASLRPGAVLDLQMNAQASGRTPLLLSHHDYWQLDGANTSVKDWVLRLPWADKVVATDSLLVPTGFANVTGTAYDFLQAQPIGARWNDTANFAGPGALGYDTCWVDREDAPATDVKLEVHSPASGIKLSLRTDQPALQVYTCHGQDGTTPLKTSQGGGTVAQDSCMVIEAEGVIDAINHPEWEIDQWYIPTRPYSWRAEYSFSIVDV